MALSFNGSLFELPKVTLRACLVGAYLFSVPAFSYSSTSLSVIPQVMGVLLVAYALLDVLKGLKLDLPLEVVLYGLMGVFIVVTFHLLPDPSLQGTERIGSLLKIVVAMVACAQLLKDEADLKTSLNIFILSIFVVLGQNFGDLRSLSRTGADSITEVDRFAGTLTNANLAAAFALTVIWACGLLILLSGGRRLRRALYAAPIGISLMIIYYSGSKKALIGTALFALFFARMLYIRQGESRTGRRRIIVLSLALVGLAGYFVATSPFFFRMEQLFLGGSISDLKRLDLMREALGVWFMNVRTFFVGVGYENFRLYSQFQAYSHSTVFELLACNGLIGFSLFTGFFFVLTRRFVRLFRTAPDRQSQSVSFYVLIFLAIIAFFMLTAILHDSRELMPILGCLAAYGQYLTRRQKEINPV